MISPNKVTSPDAAMTTPFHIGCPGRGASEFHRYVALSFYPDKSAPTMNMVRQSQFGPRPPHVLRKVLAVSLSLALHLALPACAALASGVYQTLSGATVREWGDRVPNGSRMVPLFATLRFDLTSTPPSLTAVMTNAVLEGGDPFALTIRSSSGSRLANGTYRFQGDYLREIYPSGTQYGFDYQFSASTNGEVLWNGMDYWAGGHLWYVMISNITLVPVPWLDIAQVGPVSVQIAWATNFADHVLESTTRLPAPGWGTVTNAPVIAGERVSVTLDMDVSIRFYRLRKP